MNYLELFNNSYKMMKSEPPFCDGDYFDKLDYLAEAVFGFETYESEVCSKMTRKVLEVCNVITDRTKSVYLDTEEGHFWYMIMVNMPFFKNKLEWGTSIRGAWWDLHGDEEFSVKSSCFMDGDNQIEELKFNKEQWIDFIRAMNDFVND